MEQISIKMISGCLEVVKMLLIYFTFNQQLNILAMQAVNQDLGIQYFQYN